MSPPSNRSFRAATSATNSLNMNKVYQGDVDDIVRDEKMSRAAPESSYLRTVISRFGGTIKEGNSVAIPPQSWNSKIVYGKDSFRSREVGKPTHEIRSSGVPGYMGWVPHGPEGSGRRAPNAITIGVSSSAQRFHATDYKALDRSMMPNRKQLLAPPRVHKAARDDERAPRLRAHHFAHSRRPLASPTRVAQSRHPLGSPVRCPVRVCARTGMPIVGYSGHLRKTKESAVCFGTSHWRPTNPPNRAAAMAVAYEAARQKALDSHIPGAFSEFDKDGDGKVDPYTA